MHAPGGLGKTELAKQAAEKLKNEFEILWVDVGEKKPIQVIGELLTKCGIQTQPGDPYERLVNELHHAYQKHRFLVILDDVRKESLANLNDLLPPSPCAALVTSRIQQMGGVKNFPLDSMNWDQATELFQAVLGDDVVSAELDTLMTLADRCKFNPLAMEIAARRIRQFTGMKNPVARYFEIAQAKFSELKMEGDERWDMERIFDISYDDLSDDDRVKFQMLSAFHPTGFSVEAVSFLWKSEPSVARRILSRFINLSLVKTLETDNEHIERYRLHDLLDEYAAPKLKASGKFNETKTSLADWLAKLFDAHYTDDISSAPHVALERDNLLYICEWARGEEQANILALLTTKARNWFYVSFTEAWVYWFAWLEACLQLGVSENRLKANVLKAIGDVQQFRKETDAALASYEEALKLFRQVGEKLGEANVLSSQGQMYLPDDLDKANDFLNQAIQIYQQIGSRYSVPAQIGNFGWKLLRLDEREKAKQYLLQAADLFEKMGLMDYAERHRQAASEDVHPQTEEEQITQFVQIVVRVIRENNSEAPRLLEAVSKMAVDPEAPPHYQELGNVLKKFMSGVKDPDLSRLPKEIAEIVQKAIEE